MNSLRYRFEELPDFRDGDFRSGAHDGCAEIAYSHSGEWLVRAISLDCHNGKLGGAARGRTIPLSRAYQGWLFEALCDSLDTLARGHIQDAVERALANDGVGIAEPEAEHRLRVRELA
jgi:hypothetical protein